MLRKLREERGLTQAQLAGMVGVTDRAIGKWEARGVAKAQFAVMGRLAKALGVSMEELLDRQQ